MAKTKEVRVVMRRPHPKQAEFLTCPAKRIVIRAGRRGGKTTGLATLAVRALSRNRRVLYTAPTSDQVSRFWSEVYRALEPAIAAGIYRKNEGTRTIALGDYDRSTSEAGIRAKTAWNPDMLRGDFADYLIFDEWQLMRESAWNEVGAPMLLDNDGIAVFAYTPPSLMRAQRSNAEDVMHAAKMYAKAQEDVTQRWRAFHFTSFDNPHISRTAIEELAQDITGIAYRQEILAEDIIDVPGALWTSEQIESRRVPRAPDSMPVICIGVDPQAAVKQNTMTGIVASGGGNGEVYVLGDYSINAQPEVWAARVIEVFDALNADYIVAETNQGGDMVVSTLRSAGLGDRPVRTVHAKRGKALRAHPISVLFQDRPHGDWNAYMVGSQSKLELQMTQWIPGMDSPHSLDAMVYSVMGVQKYSQSSRAATGRQSAAISRSINDYESIN